VAEGIEDEATLELVKGMGINFLQGFHLGTPQPLDR
jgi:EAL domain-containing protein (putative c-di-GMP-specific phosphodiesterase class I)